MRCLLAEAKIFNSKCVPTLEEWLQISVYSIGVVYIIIGLVLCHWDLATKEAMIWSASGPKLSYISSRNGRILDDIHTFKVRQTTV